jgi:hypothetical protein
MANVTAIQQTTLRDFAFLLLVRVSALGVRNRVCFDLSSHPMAAHLFVWQESKSPKPSIREKN